MRLGFLVEGQTEEAFVNNVLLRHLGSRGIYPRSAQKITTSRRRHSVYKGGIVPYPRFLTELVRLLKADNGLVLTTMIDYYALPDDYFPEDAPRSPDAVEAKIRDDVEKQIGSFPERIIPYVQVHEFETLLLAKPDEIGFYFGDESAAEYLSQEIAPFGEPEKVNRSPEGAPSKRIIRYFPDYGLSKATVGPTVATRIGLTSIRRACPRFNRWVELLESVK